MQQAKLVVVLKLQIEGAFRISTNKPYFQK